MNPQFAEFLVRYGPILYIVGFIAFLAIPVALMMIWNELAKLNKHLRVQQAIENARLAEEQRRS